MPTQHQPNKPSRLTPDFILFSLKERLKEDWPSLRIQSIPSHENLFSCLDHPALPIKVTSSYGRVPDLKRCPFCGASAAFIFDGVAWGVFCSGHPEDEGECCASLGFLQFSSPEDAAFSWNRRELKKHRLKRTK